VSYAVENALYQWSDGEDRLRQAPDVERGRLERAVDVVVDELRRRLGSRFLIGELAALYAEGTDWAADLAQGYAAGTDAAAIVDAAFSRYARESSDFAGGRPRETHQRPDRTG
jgi:hypothetical protein